MSEEDDIESQDNGNEDEPESSVPNTPEIAAIKEMGDKIASAIKLAVLVACAIFIFQQCGSGVMQNKTNDTLSDISTGLSDMEREIRALKKEIGNGNNAIYRAANNLEEINQSLPMPSTFSGAASSLFGIRLELSEIEEQLNSINRKMKYQF